MLDFNVSLVPFLVIALANFVLSWLFYSPVVPWFKAWARGAGMDLDKKEMTEAEKKMMPILMGGAVFSSLVLSCGLQVLVHSLKVTDFATGALVGLFIWVVFGLTHSLNSMFEGRKPVVVVINSGHYILTYALFGGILAVWK